MSPVFAGFTTMGTGARLASGGLVDRGAPLPFTFDGRAYTGFAGDTLASALMANGVRLLGRSFKYHRPRGLVAAGSEEPNALMELRTGARREPNIPATVVELFAGLEARSQNRFPGLDFDLMAVNGLLGPLFGAGFYYKTFMWPAAFWERVYEPLIRRAAGLGAGGGGAGPRPLCAGSPALRRAGDRRGAGGARCGAGGGAGRGAGGAGRRGLARGRAAAGGAGGRRRRAGDGLGRGSGRGAAVDAGGAGHAAHDGVRRL